MRRFEYLHTVLFEETNVVGNVYFSNYIKWQGHCRELFLHQKAPAVIRDMEAGLALVTLSAACNYIGELKAFDQVLVCMYLSEVQQNRLKLKFEYYKREDAASGAVAEDGILTQGNVVTEGSIVAQGTHEIGFFRRDGSNLLPTAIPAYILAELSAYANQS